MVNIYIKIKLSELINLIFYSPSLINKAKLSSKYVFLE